MVDPLNNETFYTIFVRWHGEVRPFTVENAMIETEAEVIDALVQNPNAFVVFRHDFDSPRRDVSEDIARLWLAKLKERGVDPRTDTLPAFIGLYLDEDEIERVAERAAA